VQVNSRAENLQVNTLHLLVERVSTMIFP